MALSHDTLSHLRPEASSTLWAEPGGDDQRLWSFAADAVAAGQSVGLAVLKDVDGRSPRPVGAMIAVREDGAHVGQITSGCAESAIAADALATLEARSTRSLRYGKDSPFIDVTLPCGSGLDVLFEGRVPEPLIHEALRRSEARETYTLAFRPEAAPRLDVHDERPGTIMRTFRPELRFRIAGRGPDLTNLVAAARALGYRVHALSPEREALDVCRRLGAKTTQLTSVRDPLTFDDDVGTAIVLAFHDHEWEPMLLAAALETPAFYVGAVGSAVTHAERLMKLRAAGQDENAVARVRGTIGLIGKARDPRVLAISILSDILAAHQADTKTALHEV